MNTSTNGISIEPRWATYLKSAAFIAPAIVMWSFSIIFVIPKLKWLCEQAGVVFPAFYRVCLGLTEHFVLVLLPFIIALGILEWRSVKWRQYRKAFLGLSVFVLNTVILVLVTASVVLAILAAPAMMNHHK